MRLEEIKLLRASYAKKYSWKGTMCSTRPNDARIGSRYNNNGDNDDNDGSENDDDEDVGIDNSSPRKMPFSNNETNKYWK